MPMITPQEAFESAQGLYEQGSYRASAIAAEKLYKKLPFHPPVIALYVAVLFRLQRLDDGVRIATRALRNITNLEHRMVIITQLCDGLMQTGKLDDAIALVHQDIEKAPDQPELIRCYANLLVMADRKEDALVYLDAARERGVDGLAIAAAFGRAALRIDRRDEAIDWLNELLGSADESDDTAKGDRYAAANALGHLLDKGKRYDEAMAAFTLANETIKPDYKPEQIELYTSIILKHWKPDRFVGLKKPEPSGARPVFIVGMPRSGTTLAEQILDAHPKAYGAGELGLIVELFRDLAPTIEKRYETTPDQYDPEELAKVARIYREETARMAGDDGLEVIVDKAPMNYYYLGMIAAAFPDAKIIHCQRDPRDNCLSCYFQGLNSGHSYSFDLASCGHFYRNYRQVMRHYTKLLASDPIQMPIFENVYEDMVLNQETRTRELLDFVGLDFDPVCLSFHSSGRIATTLSNDQVRQPMYTTSTKRYERYAKHIGALVESLGDVNEDQ